MWNRARRMAVAVGESIVAVAVTNLLPVITLVASLALLVASAAGLL